MENNIYTFTSARNCDTVADVALNHFVARAGVVGSMEVENPDAITVLAQLSAKQASEVPGAPCYQRFQWLDLKTGFPCPDST